MYYRLATSIIDCIKSSIYNSYIYSYIGIQTCDMPKKCIAIYIANYNLIAIYRQFSVL